MELRARTRPTLRRAAMTAALGALLLPAVTGVAAAKTKKSKLPVITSVAPKSISVGETLTIRGKNFRRGRNKNTVLFKRDKAKAVFVKADVGTAKLLRLTVPKVLEKSMIVVDGHPAATRFHLRVLAARLGKGFTKNSLSPIVGPEKPPAPPLAPEAAADGDCDGDGVVNKNDSDDDNDLLPDTTEVKYALDPCKSDTDGDGVSDGFEYRSALDLNDDEYQDPNGFAPYPGKRPYPNPLDGSDANTDFDGDGLTLDEEFGLWNYTLAHGAGASLDALTYSDGLKYSMSARGADGRRRPTLLAAGYDKASSFQSWLQGNGYWTVVLPFDSGPRPLLDVNRNGVVDAGNRTGYLHPEASWLDSDGDGYLSDDERDEDGDGLSNWIESHGMMAPDWWAGRYKREQRFRIAYAGTSLTDADSDGDGILDGADDQDHDDIPNLVELSRNMVTGRPFDDPKTPKDAGNPTPEYGRVNPFNPCEPLVNGRTCPTYIPFEGVWAPFDGPPWSDGDDPNYLVLN